jgi:hypothetical protein
MSFGSILSRDSTSIFSISQSGKALTKAKINEKAWKNEKLCIVIAISLFNSFDFEKQVLLSPDFTFLAMEPVSADRETWVLPTDKFSLGYDLHQNKYFKKRAKKIDI